ncbi:MAG: hypothetical protein DFNUSKGM_001342 [Candidatus Fervidibacter sacchari]
MLLWVAVLLGFTASLAWGQAGSDSVLLMGTLFSHDGKPVYGAFIYLDPPEGDLPQHTPDWQSDRPDGFSVEGGRFTIVRKPPGKYRLTVWIGKQRVHVLPVELKVGEQKIEVRLPPMPALRGKVVDDEGKPVPHMMVLLVNPESKESRVAVSDLKGEFILLLPPPGEANITVMTMAGDQPLTQQKVVVAGDKDEELVLKLPLGLPRFTVKLLKVDGKPLSNAPVTVTVWFKTSELKTDENGHVTLSPMPQVGKQRVLIRAKGEGWAVIIVDPKQIPTEPVSVRLLPFASVSGKVVNPDGKPIADAEVEIGPVTPNPFPIGNLGWKVRTDKQGQFKIGELWAGNFSLRVESERYRTMGVASNVVWVAPGQSKTVTIVAAPVKKPIPSGATILGHISGQVIDPEGKPVAEATVQLNKQLPSPWGFFEAKPSEPVKTDEQGRFELKNVPSGWHVLSARTKDGKDTARWVYVPPAKDKPAQVSVTLQIPKEFGSIKGKVLKDGGKTPAAGIGIMAIECHYYLVNMWGVEQAALNLQVNENQTICVGGG